MSDHKCHPCGMSRTDEIEVRAKCNICGFELTYPEFILLQNKCVFHAEMPRMSWFTFLRMAILEFKAVRKKLKMKSKGMSEIDWQACVNTVAEDLSSMKDAEAMGKFLKALQGHKGVLHVDE